MEARLKTSIQVQALIRRCDIATVAAVVTARGDPDAGAMIIKLDGRAAGVVVLTQTRRADGTLGWLRATGATPVDYAAADAYIARQRQRDPDLWVIEIETAAPESLLDAAIIA